MNLDEPLLYFDGHPWTYRDSFAGTHIFGGIGSGKSKGSGKAIARALVRAGYGGLVLTVKANEAEAWKEYMREAGREADFVRVNPESGHRFNFLEYEATRKTRGGGLTQNITSLFLEAINEQAVRSADPFWDNNMRKLLGHAVDANLLATGSRALSLYSLNKTIASAPKSHRGRMADSFCARLLKRAQARFADLSVGDRQDLERAKDFFGKEFPDLDEKPRSIVVSCFTSKADELLRAPHRAMFAEPGEPTFPPELTHQGKVIVLDIPIHEFDVAGRFAQRLYKLVWQRAAQQRGVSEHNRPLFLWCDEAHYFLTDADSTFQSTCRDYRVAGVYLAQNLPNYYNFFGARIPDQGTMGFLGTVQTKIFHQNSDTTTNKWAESLFGLEDVPRITESIQDPGAAPPGKTIFDFAGTGGRNVTTGYEERPRVPSGRFARLRTPEQTASEETSFLTDAIIYYRNSNVIEETFRVKDLEEEDLEP